MEEFFRSLPKHVLALLVIGGGILFIIASDPPVTVCSHQIKVFEEAETGNLVKDPKQKFRDVPRFDKLVDICKQANNLGGCYELFNSIRKTLDRSRGISLECLPDWGGSSMVKNYFQKSLTSFVEMAWGPQPPKSELFRLNWLESPQLRLFCRLQDSYILTYGENAWAQKREQLLAALPGFKELGREKAWGRSLVSLNCSSYRKGVL